MNAPLLSATEAQAHLTIVSVLHEAKTFAWHWTVTRDATWIPLEQFRPRCPACRRVLNWSRWVDGMREVWCVCGSRVRECL